MYKQFLRAVTAFVIVLLACSSCAARSGGDQSKAIIVSFLNENPPYRALYNTRQALDEIGDKDISGAFLSAAREFPLYWGWLSGKSLEELEREYGVDDTPATVDDWDTFPYVFHSLTPSRLVKVVQYVVDEHLDDDHPFWSYGHFVLALDFADEMGYTVLLDRINLEESAFSGAKEDAAYWVYYSVLCARGILDKQDLLEVLEVPDLAAVHGLVGYLQSRKYVLHLKPALDDEVLEVLEQWELSTVDESVRYALSSFLFQIYMQTDVEKAAAWLNGLQPPVALDIFERLYALTAEVAHLLSDERKSQLREFTEESGPFQSELVKMGRHEEWGIDVVKVILDADYPLLFSDVRLSEDELERYIDAADSTKEGVRVFQAIQQLLLAETK